MNNVTLVGRLVRDPEVRYTSSTQMAVARFTVAVDRPVSAGKERQTDFISTVAFGKTAEFIERFFTKGRLIGIQGRIQTGSYEKDGRKVYTTDVIADRVQFLDRGTNSGSANYQSAPAASMGEEISEQTPEGFEKLTDDDIPF